MLNTKHSEKKQDSKWTQDKRILIEFVTIMDNFYPKRNPTDSAPKTQIEQLQQTYSKVWLVGLLAVTSSGWLAYSLLYQRNRPGYLDLAAVIVTIVARHYLQELEQSDLQLHSKLNQSVSDLFRCLNNLSDKTRQLLFQTVYFRDYKKIIDTNIETQLGDLWLRAVDAVRVLKAHPGFKPQFQEQVRAAKEDARLRFQSNLRWDFNKGKLINRKYNLKPASTTMSTIIEASEQVSLKTENKSAKIEKPPIELPLTEDPKTPEIDLSNQNLASNNEQSKNGSKKSAKPAKFKVSHKKNIYEAVTQNQMLLPISKWFGAKTPSSIQAASEQKSASAAHANKWIESTTDLQNSSKKDHIVSVETWGKENKSSETAQPSHNISQEMAQSISNVLLQLQLITQSTIKNSTSSQEFLFSSEQMEALCKNLPTLLWSYIFLEKYLISLPRCQSLLLAIDENLAVFFYNAQINQHINAPKESKGSAVSNSLRETFIEYIRIPFVNQLLHNIFSAGSLDSSNKVKKTSDILMSNYEMLNPSMQKLQNYFTFKIEQAYLQNRSLIEKFLPWIAAVILVSTPSSINSYDTFKTAAHNLLNDAPLLNCIFFKGERAFSYDEKNNIFKNLFHELTQWFASTISPFWNQDAEVHLMAYHSLHMSRS